MSTKHKVGAALAIVVCALVAVGVAWVVRARSQSAYASCITMLKRIAGAKAAWALEMKKENNDAPTWADLLGRDRYISEMPVCPQGGTYSLGRVAEQPRCSYPGLGHSLADLEPTNEAKRQPR